MYTVPDDNFKRLHHCRPRFKSNRENVLLYIASEICQIGEKTEIQFSQDLYDAITLFPGNGCKTKKTINNWRTEITTLLGLVEFNSNGNCKPSRMAEILSSKQDLIEFFRFFCFKFQYPGGHLKPNRSLELIQLGVKFNPARYLLRLMLQGNKENSGKFGLSKEEATHCVFNDLRVTRDNRDPAATLKLIMDNRIKKTEYDCSGDVVRYAGDILDYMELANLVMLRPNGKYYAKTYEVEVISSFVESTAYFPLYEELYTKSDITVSNINDTQEKWFDYVNENLNEDLFASDILSIIGDGSESEEQTDSSFIVGILKAISKKQKENSQIKTKEIGDAGESIAIQHEKIRLTKLEREDLAKKVVKLPENLSAGYDINSFEGIAEIKRCIEVKATISKNKVNIMRFHMTPNEWGAAETFKEAYYIYRLMISSEGVSLFIINDPVGQYKMDNMAMTPRNGVDITYSEKSGYIEGVLG